MTVPYTFGTATTSIPLSNLDANFNTPITLGNTSIYLGNTTTTIGNLTLTNATISSGNVTLTNVSVTTANVTNITVSGTANIATGNVTTLTSTSITDSGLTSGRVTYAGASGLLTDSSALTYNGTALTASASSAISGVFNRLTSSGATLQIQVVGSSIGTLGSDTGGNSVFDIAAVNSMYLRATGASSTMVFSTNNTTAMTLDADGDLGIGATNPLAKLHIKGSGTSGQVSASFILENSSSGTSGMDITGTPGASRWRFLYGGGPSTGTNALTEAMCILTEGASAGKVGIGTSNPTGKLEITSSAATENALKLTGSTTAAAYLQAITTGGVFAAGLDNSAGTAFGGSAYSGNLYMSGAYPMLFWTSGTKQMTLDSSGNLGLGVTPSAWGTSSVVFKSIELGVVGSGISGLSSPAIPDTEITTNAYYNSGWKYAVSSYPALRASLNGDVSGAFTWNQAASGTAGNAITFTQAMTLDASGNLLVGTTSASNGAARLDVVAPTGNNLAATLKNDAGAGQWNTQIWNAGTSGDNGFVQFATETSYTGRGSITYNRAGGLVAYNVTSDYRAKDIISTTVNSGEVIDSVPVYMGKMKDATQERPMFIAHETPSYAHTGEKDAVDVDGNPVYQQMDASTLIPVMWAEIQSLRQRIKTLENK